jgi:MFS family permease
VSAALRRSFTSLAVPNYRRYFAGQLVSLSGNWTQVVAEMWLILALTGSGLAVGVTSALQFLPLLLFGAWGGLLADRFPKRSVLTVTQTLMAFPALTLWAVTSVGVVAPWMVFALVFARGAINAVDNPTRQSFAIEMVGADRIVNAVSLNSVLIHSARILGPATAGVLITTLGVGTCFLVNALSFGAMVIALRTMEPHELRPAPEPSHGPGAVREGLRYVRRTPALAIPLAMMALVGTLGYNFQVILPLLARFSFDGGASTYTALAVAMGAGSVIGALVAGARGRVGPGLLVAAAFGFGAVALIAAGAPTLPLEAIALVPLGAASVTFAAGINSSLQLTADPAMRGRVMALYSVVFLGSTPIGGPITGWLSQSIDPRAGLVLAGASGVIAAIGARAAFRRAGTPAIAVRDGQRPHLGRRHSAGARTRRPLAPAAGAVDGRPACDRAPDRVPESA